MLLESNWIKSSNVLCLICLINVQYSQGGPIIAVQVENEYGSYATDDKYMPFVQEVGNTVKINRNI